MQEEFKRRLTCKGFLILDGAWGTELVKRGLSQGECAELWNLSHPEKVMAIAEEYKKAGADIILTNTFGGNFFKLKKSGISSRAKVKQINKKGVQLSKKVAGDSLVFASLGPTGEFIAPLGEVTEEEVSLCFSEQVSAFLEAGADGVVIETMLDIKETKCALTAAREKSDFPVAVSMTFNKGERGYATVMGVTPQQAVDELEKAGADVVGANCGFGIEDMVEIASIMRSCTRLPLWVKPNAGIPQLEKGKTIYPHTPENMAKYVPRLIGEGVNMIGGCCGTTSQHIRLIAREAESCREVARQQLAKTVRLRQQQ